jgi:membrane associated rhomboid family serine protease
MASKAENFRRNLRQLWNSPASWTLIGVLFIVQMFPYAWDWFSSDEGSGFARLDQIHEILGLEKDRLLSGNFWQIVSYTLIHGNWAHFILNAAAILLLGSKLEHIISKRSFVLLCIYSAITGGLTFLMLSGSLQTLVGSSAICFGFLLFLTTLSPDSRFLPVFLSGRSLGALVILANLILALLNPALPTGPLAEVGAQLSKSFKGLFTVSHACHFGGAMTGWLYGKYLLRPRVSLARLRKAREKAERKNGSAKSD